MDNFRALMGAPQAPQAPEAPEASDVRFMDPLGDCDRLEGESWFRYR